MAFPLVFLAGVVAAGIAAATQLGTAEWLLVCATIEIPVIARAVWYLMGASAPVLRRPLPWSRTLAVAIASLIFAGAIAVGSREAVDTSWTVAAVFSAAAALLLYLGLRDTARYEHYGWGVGRPGPVFASRGMARDPKDVERLRTELQRLQDYGERVCRDAGGRAALLDEQVVCYEHMIWETPRHRFVRRAVLRTRLVVSRLKLARARGDLIAAEHVLREIRRTERRGSATNCPGDHPAAS
jgi:hypothetical protein